MSDYDENEGETQGYFEYDENEGTQGYFEYDENENGGDTQGYYEYEGEGEDNVATNREIEDDDIRENENEGKRDRAAYHNNTFGGMTEQERFFVVLAKKCSVHKGIPGLANNVRNFIEGFSNNDFSKIKYMNHEMILQTYLFRVANNTSREKIKYTEYGLSAGLSSTQIIDLMRYDSLLK